MQNIGYIIIELERNLTIDSLKKSYDDLSESELDDYGNKLLAEICYIIANKYLIEKDIKNAKNFAEQSYNLYHKLNISTLENSIPILSKYLPENMHEGVVKSRLLSKIN